MALKYRRWLEQLYEWLMIYDDTINMVYLEPNLSFSPVIVIVNEQASFHYYMLIYHFKPMLNEGNCQDFKAS